MVNKDHEKLNAIPLKEVNSEFGKFRYSLFLNGEWESVTMLKDGTIYQVKNGHWDWHPVSGDIRFRISEWNGHSWIDKDIRHY